MWAGRLLADEVCEPLSRVTVDLHSVSQNMTSIEDSSNMALEDVSDAQRAEALAAMAIGRARERIATSPPPLNEETRRDKARLSGIRKDLAATNREIAEKKAELISYRQAVDDLKNEHSRLQGEIAAAKRDNAILQANLERQRAEAENVQIQLQTKISYVQAQFETAKKQLDEEKTKLDKASKELQDKQTEMISLRSTAQELQGQVSSLETDLDKVKAEREAVQGQLQDATNNLKLTNAELIGAQANIASQTQTILSQNAAIAAGRDEIDALNATIDSKSAEIDQQTKEIASKAADIAKNESIITRLNADIENKKRQIAILNQALELLAEEEAKAQYNRDSLNKALEAVQDAYVTKYFLADVASKQATRDTTAENFKKLLETNVPGVTISDTLVDETLGLFAEMAQTIQSALKYLFDKNNKEPVPESELLNFIGNVPKKYAGLAIKLNPDIIDISQIANLSSDLQFTMDSSTTAAGPAVPGSGSRPMLPSSPSEETGALTDASEPKGGARLRFKWVFY